MSISKPLMPKSEHCAATGVLTQVLREQPQLEFAVLVGSRAAGTYRADSDWDVALQWAPQLDWLTVLDKTETLRRTLAQRLNAASQAIDLIELRRANLAMRASVAEDGVPLAGQNSLAWARFFAAHLARAGRLLLGQATCGLTFTKPRQRVLPPSRAHCWRKPRPFSKTAVR